MTKITENGGPAFPIGVATEDNNGVPLRPYDMYALQGMSLRDFFAAQALASGLCRTGGVPEHELREKFGGRNGIRREEIAAADAYAFADAMLARRA